MTPAVDLVSTAPTPETTIHGVLVEVYGVGVLILGDSGVGKTRCGLQLIERGHKLISDDSVLISVAGGRLIGKPPDTIRDLIEIRGRGIVNARVLFGESAISKFAEIGFCVELIGGSSYCEDAISNLEIAEFTILGVTIPKYFLKAMSGPSLDRVTSR